MRYVLGFDGGGTKTECVLMDETGHVLSQSRGGPSNPNRVGFGGATVSVCDAGYLAVSKADVSIDDIKALCAGLAGTAHPESAVKMKRLLEEEFSGRAVRVCTDLDLTLESAGTEAAIVLIAGTGSAAVGRDAQGKTGRVGGHGYLLGDEGSAYHVGQRTVREALRHFERTGKDTALGKRILVETGEPSWPELQSRINAAPDEIFPRLFPIVLGAAESGDASARAVLHECAAALGELVSDLAERLRLQSEEVSLAKSGGMLGRSAFFDQWVDEQLRKAVPFAQFGALQMTPAEAAARMALRLLAPA
jgi:N-acetylglucosamine kinase